MNRTLSIETELAKVCGPAHDLDNHYICSICFKVVSNPVECSKCNKAFCKECAEGWSKQNSKCPISRCERPEYVPLHRYMLKLLQKHNFFCPMKGC